MVLVHMAGNGRGATKGVKRDFAERRVKAAQLKADQARRRKPAPVHLCTCTRLHACTLRRCAAAPLRNSAPLYCCAAAPPPLHLSALSALSAPSAHLSTAATAPPQVRAAGHGTQAQAARLARQHNLEHNRELASKLRHEQASRRISPHPAVSRCISPHLAASRRISPYLYPRPSLLALAAAPTLTLTLRRTVALALSRSRKPQS